MEEQIGDRIAKERKRLNMTQSELAEKLMVSNKAISKWESNGGNPSIEFLPKLADIFGCTIDYLVRGEGDDKDNKVDSIDQFIAYDILSYRFIQMYFKLGYSKAVHLVEELNRNNFLNEFGDIYSFNVDKKDEIKRFIINYLDKNKS